MCRHCVNVLQATIFINVLYNQKHYKIIFVHALVQINTCLMIILKSSGKEVENVILFSKHLQDPKNTLCIKNMFIMEKESPHRLFVNKDISSAASNIQS